MNRVWVVTYWDGDEEPVVSVFNSKDAAYACYEWFSLQHDECCIDYCEVYSTFSAR